MHARRATHQGGTSERSDVWYAGAAAVAAAIAAATAAARFATAAAVLLPAPYRQRAKGTRIGVLAGGGAAVHLFASILERVQTMGARCHVIPECTGYYIYLYQSMLPDTRCWISMPRAFLHQISAAAVL